MSFYFSICVFISSVGASEAVVVNPQTDPHLLGYAAARLIEIGDYQNGIRLLEKAIDSNSKYCFPIEYGDSFER